MPRLALAGLLCALPLSAVAHDAVPRGAGHYCLNGGIAAAREALAGPTSLPDAIARHCSPGDVVTFYASQIDLVATFCDFDRAIIQSNDTVLCIMVARRPLR